MQQERLLERVRKMEESPFRRISNDPEAAITSVLEYLSRVLNTKQGSADIDLHLGVPDLSNLSSTFSPEAIPELEVEIQRVIKNYEPRLQDVTVHFRPAEDDVLALKFSISAKLATDDKSRPVIFETIVDSDGQVRLAS